MLNPYIITTLLGLMPISEGRGAIIYGLSTGLNPYYIFTISLVANITIIPILFSILKQTHFMQLTHRILGKRISSLIEKNKERFELYEELALLTFVAIPLPGTGAYTGAILASVLDLNRKKSFFIITLGIVIALTIVFLSTQGILLGIK